MASVASQDNCIFFFTKSIEQLAIFDSKLDVRALTKCILSLVCRF